MFAYFSSLFIKSFSFFLKTKNNSTEKRFLMSWTVEIVSEYTHVLFIISVNLHCCVTLCKYHFEKNTNISFHKFLLNNCIWSKWLKIIYLKNFHPDDKSNSSRLGSKHFKEIWYILFLEPKCRKFQLVLILHGILIDLLFLSDNFHNEGTTYY